MWTWTSSVASGNNGRQHLTSLPPRKSLKTQQAAEHTVQCWQWSPILTENIRLSPRWTYLKWKYCIKVCNFLLMQISLRFSTLVILDADCWSWARAAPSAATNATDVICAAKLCNRIAILTSCFSNDGVLKSQQPFTRAKVLIYNFLSRSVMLVDVRLFGSC